MSKLPKLEPIDEHILTELSSTEEHCWGYHQLESNGYKRPELRKAIKKLRDLNYVEYWRGGR